MAPLLYTAYAAATHNQPTALYVFVCYLADNNEAAAVSQISLSLLLSPPNIFAKQQYVELWDPLPLPHADSRLLFYLKVPSFPIVATMRLWCLSTRCAARAKSISTLLYLPAMLTAAMHEHWQLRYCLIISPFTAEEEEDSGGGLPL